jgi:uncharacterized phage protein gp47/JayE
MPWPTPAPGQIASRAASIYEEQLPGIDARNPNTVATTNTRIVEMAMLDLYFLGAYIASELMPDTAVDLLYRHAAIWGVPQDQPAAAAGPAIFVGTPTKVIPAGVPLTYQGQGYLTTAAGTIASSGQIDIQVQATTTGSAGNLPAGTVLTITSPVEGVSPQTATVDTSGITGGLDLESTASWRSRILAKIREEPSGGDYDDYVQAAEDALPNVIAACPPAACGQGAVAVFIAIQTATGPIVATDEEVAEVQAYIEAEMRPVTATVTVYAATLNPVNISLQLRPNTTNSQAAASAALALFFAQNPQIGGTTYFAPLNSAVSTSDGETYHEMLSPTTDVPAPNLGALNVLGTVTYS